MEMIADDIIKFTFSGDPADPIKRHLTGMYSFDRAFETSTGQIGMPIGTGYEIFGAKSIGKSTFCYSLLAILGKSLATNVVLTDLEGFDSNHLKNILSHIGYTGNIYLIHQGQDEEILEKFEDIFLQQGKFESKDGECKYTIGMLDSIAAISPVAERQGDLGSANMGRRAFLMAQFSRRLLPTIHPRTVGSENLYFLINHWYGKIGEKGYQSPGGNVKDYLCGGQIHLARKYINWGGKQLRNFPDGSYRLEGTLYKNRYGFDRKTFTVFVKSGVGIHLGLTAMFDALDLKVAKRSKTIKIGDASFGYLKDILTKEWENDEFFQPFYDALKEYGT